MQTKMDSSTGKIVVIPQTNQLIELCKRGDKEAFYRLYQLHVGRVYALCLRLTGQVSLAEEATQEVFIQVWQKLHNYHGESQFSTWLHRVASNVTISYLRAQKSFWKRMLNIEDDVSDSLVAEEGIEGIPFAEHVAKLPERARMVFVLHAIEGYRHDEIAEMMNIAVGSSKAQFHRAKQLLKEWMGYEDE